MKAVIFCGGNVDICALRYIDDGDLIVCADSGYDRALALGIVPDIIIGDMDSISADYTENDSIVYPTRKDYTDSELVIDYVIEKGADKIVMFGMIGTRFDHSFANISLLLKCRGRDAVIIDKNNIIQMLFDTVTVGGNVGDTVSILPFSGDLEGVTTTGLEYPLYDSTVRIGTSLGVSNKMTGKVCTISLKKGIALIIRSND